MKWLRRRLSWLKRTPLHPQWLLGTRRPPAGLVLLCGTLLDIGSADGWLGRHVDKATYYVALDYPPTGQALYRAKPTIFGDATQLPFGDATFDAVACLEVIEHVPSPGRVFAEIHRVLKPGGKAYFSMPFLYPVHDAPYDFSRLTADGWRQRAKEHGFLLQQMTKRTHSIRTAGLLACLAIGAGMGQQTKLMIVLLLPVVAAIVLLINSLAYVTSFIIPDWDAMGTGYELVLQKL